MINLFRKHIGRKNDESACVQVNKNDGYEVIYLKHLNTPKAEGELHQRNKNTMFLHLGSRVKVKYGQSSIDGEITALFRSGFEVKSWDWNGGTFFDNFPYKSLMAILN